MSKAGSCGHEWKSKVLRKKTRGSQTPGKTKGEACQASPLDKWMAKKSRSYKHREYASWCEKMRKFHKGKGS